MLALSVRAQSKAGGVSKTNAYINVLDVFTAHVLPEIQVGQSRLRKNGEAHGGGGVGTYVDCGEAAGRTSERCCRFFSVCGGCRGCVFSVGSWITLHL